MFWTPNKWNPAMIVSTMTGEKFSTFVRRLIYCSESEDNGHTYYKINTRGTIHKIAARVNMRVESINIASGAYLYFRINKPIWLMACIMNKVALIWPLRLLGLTILAVLRKPELESEKSE